MTSLGELGHLSIMNLLELTMTVLNELSKSGQHSSDPSLFYGEGDKNWNVFHLFYSCESHNCPGVICSQHYTTQSLFRDCQRLVRSSPLWMKNDLFVESHKGLWTETRKRSVRETEMEMDQRSVVFVD